MASIAFSRYEAPAKAFVGQFPMGTIVAADELIDWAADHKDGLASDLLIDDPGKQYTALRRHLNHGGASRGLPQDKRFYLAVEDAKRKTIVVQGLTERVSEQALAACSKSARGALSPYEQSARALEDTKLDELSDEQREQVESLLQEMTESQVPLRRLIGEQMHDCLIKRLMAQGQTLDGARAIIAV